MGLKATFIGEGEHFIVDTRGIADTQHVDAAIHQFLRDPVHRHVTLCADQYLVLASQCLVDGFDECRGLTRSRGAMDDRHILGPQHFVHCVLLGCIQIGEMDGGETEGLCLLMRIEQVTQIT